MIETDTTLTDEGRKAFESMSTPSPSCFKCNKVQVCEVFRTFNRYIKGGFDKNQEPMKVDDLAKICNWYELEAKI